MHRNKAPADALGLGLRETGDTTLWRAAGKVREQLIVGVGQILQTAAEFGGALDELLLGRGVGFSLGLGFEFAGLLIAEAG